MVRDATMITLMCRDIRCLKHVKTNVPLRLVVTISMHVILITTSLFFSFFFFFTPEDDPKSGEVATAADGVDDDEAGCSPIKKVKSEEKKVKKDKSKGPSGKGAHGYHHKKKSK